MVYEKPRYRPVGECRLLVELSDQVELVANLKAITLAKQLMQVCPLGPSGIEAIVDLIPSFNTVLIEYEPTLLTQQGLIGVCNYAFRQLATQSDIEVISRLIEIPVTYNDRWCRACFEHYCQTIKPIEDNLELVCRLNGLTSVQALIDRHTKTEWWVGAVGFVAGLPTLMPLDTTCRLHAPKYDPPRTWTPKGTIGIGGGFTTIYPVVIPDGYQMVGRTPVPIFDAAGRLSPFKDHPLLFRVGDRVKFKSISEEEFEAIEYEIADRRYKFSISAPEKFPLNRYLKPDLLKA
ncbi:MAG: carboxyltransferase domain-containing protein [Pseudanabaenales cyanobacterium]|nr:carboxyltransferase domain-containing protein [Pseudanabaenales cyanobacterium]